MPKSYAKAKTPGTCGRCSGGIAVDTFYFWSNANKTRYHLKRDDGSCWPDWTPGTGTVETIESVFAEPKAERKPAAPGSIDALIDERIDARLSGFEPSSAVDEDTVKRIIRETIADSVITVRVESPDREPVVINGAHPCFPRLVYFSSKRVNGQRQNVFLHGPAGGGKTTAARMLADALSIKRWGYISLSPQAPASRIEGFIDATGTFRDTEFYRCYTEGGVFLFDEVGNMSPALGVALNTALENGHANFPDGLKPRHADFVCVAADNTPLWGGNRTYNARQAVDGAFRDRWMFLYWPIDDKLERRVALSINPNASPWVDWVQRVRAWALKEMPHLPVTPRATYRGAECLLDCATVGITVADLAETCVFKGIEDAARERAISANPLPKVG